MTVGILHFVFSSFTNFWIFSFSAPAISITYIIIGVAILLGLTYFIRFCYKKRNTLLLIRVYYWFLIYAIIIVSLIVFLAPITTTYDDGIIFFLEFSTVMISLPNLIFISVINPKVEINSSEKKHTRRPRKVYRFIVPFAILLLIASTLLFWYLFGFRIYGSDEGMAYILFFALARFNLVSFIPLCGIIHFKWKDSSTIKYRKSTFNLKILIPLVITIILGIISTVITYLSIYLNGTSFRYLISSILLSYVFIIGAITLLILFYLVEKYKISIQNYDTLLPNQGQMS